MEIISKIGVMIGIGVLYSLLTCGLAAITTMCEQDDFVTACVAWIYGLICFLILAVFTLEKFGLWA